MVTLRPEMWEVWSLSVDVVVSLCAPLAVSVLAQGTAFIGPTRILTFGGSSAHL